jgi:hypothetical protein
MRGAITPLSNTPSGRGAELNHRDTFTSLNGFPVVIINEFNVERKRNTLYSCMCHDSGDRNSLRNVCFFLYRTVDCLRRH